MKKVSSIRAGKIVVAMSVVLGSGVAGAQPNPGAGPPGSSWFSFPIEGVWNAVVTLDNCAGFQIGVPFDAMAIFARGGTFHDTNAMNPALRSAAFGTWRYVGAGTYRFAFRLFRFDEFGNNIGSTIVRHTAALAPDGESYTSEGTAEFFDKDGQPETAFPPGPSGCSSSTAVRFE